MAQVESFGVPPELDEILDLLPPRVTLNVPDKVLLEWFSSRGAGHVLSDAILKRAETYARTCGCLFGYHASIREGLFYKRR